MNWRRGRVVEMPLLKNRLLPGANLLISWNNFCCRRPLWRDVSRIFDPRLHHSHIVRSRPARHRRQERGRRRLRGGRMLLLLPLASIASPILTLLLLVVVVLLGFLMLRGARWKVSRSAKDRRRKERERCRKRCQLNYLLACYSELDGAERASE